jgi:hypothetical protein
MTLAPMTPHTADLDQVGGLAAWRITGTQSCWLCGISLPARAMIPDGSPACADIRWYCADTPACTERWTQAGRGPGPASGPLADGHGVAPLSIASPARSRPHRQRA